MKTDIETDMETDMGTDTGTDLAGMYFAVRGRILETVEPLGREQWARTVPACPEWTVHGLLSHVVALPMALVAGEVPNEVMGGGDPEPWLRRLVADHAERPFAELAAWWRSDDEALGPVVDGAGRLLADLFTHEGDLHGALGSRAPRDTPELDSQIDAAMAGLRTEILAVGLPPIGVDDGSDRRQSGPGDPGWVVRSDFWTAHRAFNSRRTREELLALEHEGDPERYLDVLDRHLPLPERSLGE